MYPRNASSPERIAIGPVVLIADGTVQTSGVTVRVIPFGGSEADGAGTTAYSTDGVVIYTPTQAETNYTSFILIAKKSACIPASVTVVTSASSLAGHAGTDQSKITNATATINLSGTTIKNSTDNASQTSVNAIPTNPLLTNDSRLNNLDFAISTVNQNILNINNLSAKMNLFGSPLLEIPDTGTTVYAFTVVVKDDEDKLINLDASPTLAAANAAGTNRSGNLSAVSNPSTGRYTFTYSVASTHASESLRITVAGAVSAEARYIEWVGSVVNYDSLTVLQLVESTVNSINTRLPASPAASGDVPSAATIRDTIMNSMPGGGWVNGSFGDRWVIGVNNNREVQVTGSNHISADIHAFQNGVLTAAAIAAGALNGKGDWLTTLGASAPVNWINAGAIADGAIDSGAIADGALNGKGNWLTSLGANAPAGWINAAAIATDAITNDKIAASAVTKITVNLFKYGDIQRWNSPANQIDVTITKV